MESQEDRLFQMSTTELWSYFRVINGQFEGDEDKKVLNTVKFGINLQVPIQYILRDWTEELPHKKKVRIVGYGYFKLMDYIEEIEKREDLMRSYILEHQDDGDITMPRN